MSDATGWAVTSGAGKVYVKTVSETRRAAIVNYLVTEKHLMIYSHHSDVEIEAMWAHHGKYVLCSTVAITVTH